MVGSWLETARAKNWHAETRPALKLPARFASATPTGIPGEALRAVVLRYIREFSSQATKGIAPALFGAPRVYKTYAAAVIARYVYGAERLDVEFVAAGSEFLTLGLKRFERSTLDRLEVLSSVSFLVLDDITNVPPAGVGIEFLTSVADRRFSNNLPTLYTGNWDIAKNLSGFAERYNLSLARRVHDGSTGFRYVVT